MGACPAHTVVIVAMGSPNNSGDFVKSRKPMRLSDEVLITRTGLWGNRQCTRPDVHMSDWLTDRLTMNRYYENGAGFFMLHRRYP